MINDDRQSRLAQLSPEKRAVLEQRLLARLQRDSDDAAIRPRATAGPAPLSFSQERQWFLRQLYPHQTAYNEPDARRFRGPLDSAALQAALDAFVQRHDVLRTTFHQQDGELVQIAGPPRPVPLPLVDLSEIDEAERLAELRKRFGEVTDVPFDLAHDLLLRCCLFRLSADDHILLAIRIHIASDAWSQNRFWDELESLYTAAITGQPARLPELTIGYADYAVWQREQVHGPRLERQLAYWREKLSDLPTLQLPTDRRRPDRLSFRGGGEHFRLSADQLEKLRELARQEATTLHTVLMTAYIALLSRITGQEDIAVGIPIAGRTRVELEPLQGSFVNTLVIRARLAGNPTFRALLRQAHQSMLEAQENQETPFEKLVEILNPERLQNHNPLIATMFQVRELPEVNMSMPHLAAERVDVPNLHGKFDMECSLVPQADGAAGHWRYAADLFDAATIRWMIGRYQTLLDGIIADPERPIDSLPLLTEDERQQLLRFSNACAPATFETGLIHQLFEAQAARAPEAAAVTLPAAEGDTGRRITLTYGELNRRANKVAHALRRWGVGPETPVALYVDRSIEMIAGILGILKAGGAYVPLDPANPPERLALIVDECRPAIVLTQGSLAANAAGLGPAGAKVISLDSDWAQFDAESDENPAVAMPPESLAYVMFTSGSTGRPKGVMVSHANVVRLFRSTEAWYGFDERDVMTLFHSFAFDASVWELWGALFYGGRIVVVPYIISRSPDLFYRLLSDEGITAIFQTPAAFRQLIQAEEAAGPRDDLALRYIVLGGAALELESLRPWFARHGDRKPLVVNMYGITETTVHDTYRPLRTVDLDEAPGSVVGVPLPDTQIYVLDARGRLAPVGVAGEIYLSGPSLARGYLNRPELTEQRFVTAAAFPEAQFDGVLPPEARLYRSGDLGRWLPNGDIEYLGRIDNQIKIRGFRIEPGEIEAAAGRHPAVREVVVIARDHEHDSGERQLVAYYVPMDKARDPDAAELRAFLSKSLPDYMIPAAFVSLPRLPLTTHGKIDRAALPRPDDAARRGVATGHVPPRTPEEEAVAAIWRETLRLERVGIHDNFFDLGGHSLLATQVVSRIARDMGIDFSLRALFDNPTVAQIAVEIAGLKAGRDDQNRKLEAALARLNDLSPEQRAALLRAKRSAS